MFQLKSKQYVSTKKGNYWNIIVDGREVGWVSQNFFARNKISVAKEVSLIKNSDYGFPTRDAINYVTDGQGTAVDPDKVSVSKTYVSTQPSTVNYSYGKAKASVNISVRDNADSEMGEVTKQPQKGFKTTTTWNGGSKGSSRNWNAAHHYTSETSSNTFSSNGLTLRTRLFQPRFLSLGYGQAGDKMGQVGVIPEGMTVNGNDFVTSLYSSDSDQHGHLALYNLGAIKSKYAAQNLTTMNWSTFKSYANNIKVSPYIKLGHGQSLGSSSNYIYVLANDNKYNNGPKSEEVMQIRKSDMCINKIWTVKTWNKGNAEDSRYYQNAVVVDDHTMYGLYHDTEKHRYEYWKLSRTGDNWYSQLVGVTDGDFVNNGAPVQGFTYDSQNNNFYISFNDLIFKVAYDGTLKQSYQFKSGREVEGISISDNKLYVNLAQRAELLVGDLK